MIVVIKLMIISEPPGHHYPDDVALPPDRRTHQLYVRFLDQYLEDCTLNNRPRVPSMREYKQLPQFVSKVHEEHLLWAIWSLKVGVSAA